MTIEIYRVANEFGAMAVSLGGDGQRRKIRNLQVEC